MKFPLGLRRAGWASALPLLLVICCSSPLRTESIRPAGTGVLSLWAESPEVQRSLLPSGARITGFSASGTGPGGTPLPSLPESVDGVFRWTDLTPGQWNITVAAKDQGGTVVATGSAQITVTAGMTVASRLPLVPVVGQGLLTLECSWPGDQAVDAVTATLIRSDETTSTVALAVQGSAAKLTDWVLPSGGWLLTLDFTKNHVRVAAPRMESVLVYAGKTTVGSFALDTSDFATSPRAKSILTFGFAAPTAVGTIDEANHTIAVLVPTSTDLTSLTPVITISGTGVSPASGSAVDFTTPRLFTVTAQDGTIAAYTVTVTRSGDQTVSVEPLLLSVSLTGQTGTLAPGTSMTVSAAATEAVDSWSWYLDAQKVTGAEGPDWTGGAALTPGPHSLMAVAARNGLLFSSTWYFRVE